MHVKAGRSVIPRQLPLGIFGCFDVRVTSDYDVGSWLDFGQIMMLDFGWILVGFAKTP